MTQKPTMTLVKFKPKQQIANELIVERLEEMMVLAKAGELKAVGIAAVKTNGDITTGFSAESECYALLGSIELLKQRIILLFGYKTP